MSSLGSAGSGWDGALQELKEGQCDDQVESCGECDRSEVGDTCEGYIVQGL